MAGDEEQRRRRHGLVDGEPFVGGGVEQVGEQRRRPRRQRAQVRVEVDGRPFACLFDGRAAHRADVDAGGEGVGPPAEGRAVGGGHAQERSDDVDRHGTGDGIDDVGAAVGVDRVEAAFLDTLEFLLEAVAALAGGPSESFPGSGRSRRRRG